MKFSLKDPRLNLFAAISLMCGGIVTLFLILTGSEKRARMNADVAERGYGYTGDFQIANSIMGGAICAAGLFSLLVIITLIRNFKNKDKV